MVPIESEIIHSEAGVSYSGASGVVPSISLSVVVPVSPSVSSCVQSIASSSLSSLMSLVKLGEFLAE